MGSNRTSQAVTKLFAAALNDGYIWGTKSHNDSKSVKSICLKYRKMEEALEQIVHDRNAWPECAKGYERQDMMDIAEEALAFDPLDTEKTN